MYIPLEDLSHLILRGEPKPATTIRRDRDCAYAMRRGLADFLRQLRADAPGGRLVKFETVREDFGEVETLAGDIAAGIYTEGALEYDPSNLGGSGEEEVEAIIYPDGSPVPGGQRFFARYPTHFKGSVTMQVQATDPEMRGQVLAMLEDDMNPGNEPGFRMLLPHYHNQTCVYLPQSVRYEDGEAISRSRRFKAYVTLSFELTQVVIRSSPIALIPQFANIVNGVDPS